MVKTQRVVITPGEPAGIGPDLVVQLAQREWPVELVVCADATLLTDRAAMLGLPLTLRPYSPNSPAQPQTAGTLTLLPVALRESVTAGQLAIENGHYVVETLARACDGCLNGEFAALITGPVHKGVINDAGIPFTGHTEFFEERSQAKKVVMMLATEELHVALATTHLPLRDIADAITPALLHEVIAILHHDLRTKFGIAEPRILVCGLNPHAGEGGHMGTEEIDTIIPVLNELRAQGMSNRRLAEEINRENPKHREVICDSAEPKSIAEMREYGVAAIGARKGPDSVYYGIKWMQDLEEIIIDPKRCPETAREFSSYEYESDGRGGWRAAFPDRDNHAIDAVRYSREEDMRHIRVR